MTAQRTTPKGKTLSAPEALEQSPLAMFATVTAACAQRGVSALDVDEMEIWQVASTLAVDMEHDDDTPAAGNGPPPPGALSRARIARMKAKA